MASHTKQQLEQFTKKSIVATPLGLYKLAKLEKLNDRSRVSYATEFISYTEDGKFNNHIVNIIIRLSSPYVIDFLGGILNIYNNSNCIDSYVEPEEEGPKQNPFFVREIFVKNGEKTEILEYFKEFFINYAKSVQNLVNESDNNPKRFNLEFKLLNGS